MNMMSLGRWSVDMIHRRAATEVESLDTTTIPRRYVPATLHANKEVKWRLLTCTRMIFQGPSPKLRQTSGLL